MGAGKTCYSLVMGSGSFWIDCQGGFLGIGGPCTALSPRLRSGGLESKFGWGPGHLGQEGNGLVLLVLGVQVGRVFSGHPAEHIDSQIAGRSDTACLVFSTVVRTESERRRNGTDCSTLA